MEHASSQTLSRLWMLALSGVVAAFAWVILSVVLGVGASNAHADDAGGSGGLLDGVTNTVSDVAGSAVDTAAGAVTQTVPAVNEGPVVASVVAVTQPVVAVAQPVVAVAQPVVSTVAEVAAPVIEPLQTGPVAPLVTPAVDVISAVPVVGDVSSVLGVDTALTQLAGTAEGGVGTIIQLPGRTIEAAPGIGLSETASAVDREEVPAVTRAALAVEASGAASVASRPIVTPIHAMTSAATVVAVALVSGPFGSFPDLLSGMSPLSSAITSPGGAGLGLGALLALGLFAAHRAWVRRNGPENEATPPAPALLTDVSPD